MTEHFCNLSSSTPATCTFMSNNKVYCNNPDGCPYKKSTTHYEYKVLVRVNPKVNGDNIHDKIYYAIEQLDDIEEYSVETIIT